MDHVAGGARHVAALVVAPRPMLALSAGVTSEAGVRLLMCGRRTSDAEVDVDQRTRGGASGVLDVRHARAVTGLATGRAIVSLDPMGRLVDGQYRPGLRFVVAMRTDGISGE